MASFPRFISFPSTNSKLIFRYRYYHTFRRASLIGFDKTATLGAKFGSDFGLDLGIGTGLWIRLIQARALSCLPFSPTATTLRRNSLNQLRKFSPATTALWIPNARSTTTSVQTTSPPAVPAAAVTKDVLDLSFEDARAAFRSKSTGEIFRAYIVFYLCTIKFLVDNNSKVKSLYILKVVKIANYILLYS